MQLILLILSLCTVLAARSWRDDLDRARQLGQAGDNAAAERLYRQTLENARDLNPAQLNALALDLQDRARFRDSEWAYRRSLEAWDRAGSQMASSRSITAGNLGILLRVMGRYGEAEPLLLERLREAEAGLDPANPATVRATASAATALATLYQASGKLNQAESFAMRADSLLRDLAGEPIERIANRRILASILLEEQRYSEGETILRSVLQGLPERSEVGVFNDLATALSRQGRLTDAETWGVQAVSMARRVFPAYHPLLAASLNNLAQIERFQGRYLEAEKNYRAAIDIWEHAFGPGNPDVAKGLMNLAAFYHERGREAGAEDLYRRAAATFETSYGKDGPLTLIARNELGDVLRAQHRFTEAEKMSKETLGPLERSLGERDPRVARALGNYARLLDETHHSPEAAAVRGRIHTLARGFLGQNP